LFAAQVGASLVRRDLVGGRWRRMALPQTDEDDSDARWSWSPDGRLLALATTFEGLRIHDARTGRLVRELPRTARSLPPTAFSPDGKTLAVQEKQSALLYDVGTGRLLPRIRVQLPRGEALMNLPFRDAGPLLVLDESPFVRTFDVRTGKEIHPGVGHRATVSDLAFAADGKTLVSIDEDGRLLRWDARTGRL